MLKEDIGKRIKNIRIEMNLPKSKFAKLLGISGQYLGMIENGKGSLSFEKLETLCKLSNLSSDYILFGVNYSSTSNLHSLLSNYSPEIIHSAFTSLEKFALFLKNSQ